MIPCDLHSLNDALIKGIEAAFGDPSLISNTTNIIQVGYRMHWLINHDLEVFRNWYTRLWKGKDTAPLPPLPITTRWETVIPSLEYILDNLEMIKSYCKYCHERRESTLSNLRSTCHEVFGLLTSEKKIFEASVIVEFADAFYNEEYFWSKGGTVAFSPISI